jgi:hypothetical protein
MSFPNIPVEYIFYALIAVLAILAFWIMHLERKIHRLLGGVDHVDLKKSLLTFHSELKDHRAFRSEMEKYLTSVETRLSKSIRGLATVRFNAFRSSGGSGYQSFATCYLNEKGDGVVISTLYTRDHTSLFSKPIKNFISEFELTPEEKEAIVKAREGLTL